MRCRSCGHDLTVVTSNRCPECGRFFDPNHPRTYLTEPQSGMVALKLASMGLVFVTLGVGASEAMQLRLPWLPAVVIALLGAAFLITGAWLTLRVLALGCRVTLGRVPWQTDPALTVAASIIAASTVLLYLAHVVLR